MSLEALQTTLTGYYVELLDGFAVINDATIWADLSFASWAGYAPEAVASLSSVTIDTNRAKCSMTSDAEFGNSSGSSQTAYGWAVVNTGSNKLLAAKMFDTPLIIPNGETRSVPVNFWLGNLVIA